MRYFRKFIYLFILSTIFSCGSTSSNTPSLDEVQNPDLGIKATSDNVNYISISKDSLDQKYLLHGAITFQKKITKEKDHILAPTSTAIKSKIVIFQKNNNEILMLDSTDIYSPDKELTPSILLTSFPIITESEKTITIDFNQGMSKHITSLDWYASDIKGARLTQDSVIYADNSYVRERTQLTDGLIIKQNINMNVSGTIVPVEFSYYISKYITNENFAPKPAPSFDNLGFFETNPRVQEYFGSPETYITKWDITKPITFYISENVPVEHRSAIEEGVLYWNKVFGSNVLEVKLAPEGVHAPDFQRNIIQWYIDLHHTGAYADANIDPVTGEIKHAQIYISGGIATLIKYDINNSLIRSLNNSYYLPDVENKVKDNEQSGDMNFTTTQNTNNTLCTIELKTLFTDINLYEKEISNLSSERMLEIINDILRYTTAHEMGHVLGLRHNFASSSVNTLSFSEEEEIFNTYLLSGEIPDFPDLHNSIMDYASIMEVILVGRMIKEKALEHDAYAIKWGYFNGEYSSAEPFCTDFMTPSFLDCRRTDDGTHLIERNLFKTIKQFKNIPLLIAEFYAARKTSLDTKKRQPVEYSTPYAGYIADSILGHWKNLIFLLTENYELLSILRSYKDFSDIDRAKVNKDKLIWLEKEIVFAGGIEKILTLINHEYYNRILNTFPTNLSMELNSPQFQNMPLIEGGETSFSPDEIKYMKTRGRELFYEIDEILAQEITQSLLKSPFKNISSAEKIEPILATWAEFIILSGHDLNFRYSFETRLNAVDLFRTKGPYLDWMEGYASPIAEKLGKKLEKSFGKPLAEVDIKEFPREDQEGLAKEINLFYKLLYADKQEKIGKN